MKHKIIWLALLAMMAFTATQTMAEIYKWKDKDGKIRYSDTPPPSNIKQEPIGKKKAVKPIPSTQENIKADKKVATPPVKDTPEPIDPADAAAEQRQRDAELEKRNKEQKDKENKAREENCRTARGNLENHTQGGRIYKMNENGEREYLDDNALEAGKIEAQKQIDENCN